MGANIRCVNVALLIHKNAMRKEKPVKFKLTRINSIGKLADWFFPYLADNFIFPSFPVFVTKMTGLSIGFRSVSALFMSNVLLINVEEYFSLPIQFIQFTFHPKFVRLGGI
jgi:hypothetical protein